MVGRQQQIIIEVNGGVYTLEVVEFAWIIGVTRSEDGVNKPPPSSATLPRTDRVRSSSLDSLQVIQQNPINISVNFHVTPFMRRETLRRYEYPRSFLLKVIIGNLGLTSLFLLLQAGSPHPNGALIN
jgi:hypothetical protein